MRINIKNPKKTSEEYNMIEELLESSLCDKLTQWEVDFLESIDGLDSLNKKQRGKLNQIYEDTVPGGI